MASHREIVSSCGSSSLLCQPVVEYATVDLARAAGGKCAVGDHNIRPDALIGRPAACSPQRSPNTCQFEIRGGYATLLQPGCRATGGINLRQARAEAASKIHAKQLDGKACHPVSLRSRCGCQAAARAMSNSALISSFDVPATIRPSSSRPFSATRVERRGIFRDLERSPLPYSSQSTTKNAMFSS